MREIRRGEEKDWSDLFSKTAAASYQSVMELAKEKHRIHAHSNKTKSFVYWLICIYAHPPKTQ